MENLELIISLASAALGLLVTTATFPSVSGSMVETTLRSVLLPEPDGPITATNSPFSTSKVTPASARGDADVGKDLCCLLYAENCSHNIPPTGIICGESHRKLKCAIRPRLQYTPLK